MASRIVRRRPDGLVEIRRRRARDVVATPDAAVLLALMGGWLIFSVALVVTLVTSPILLAMTGGFVLLGAWGVSLVRPRALETAPVEPPPRRIA
jgi:hypothetical protein